MLAGKENLMKRFKVKLHGKNFLLNLDGEPKKFVFYTTRFVKAETPQEAEKIAIILTHQNPNLRDTVLNENADGGFRGHVQTCPDVLWGSSLLYHTSDPVDVY